MSVFTLMTRLGGMLGEGPASMHIFYLNQSQIMYAESLKLAPTVQVPAFREVPSCALSQTDTFYYDFPLD